MAKGFKDLAWDYLVFSILIICSFVIPLWNRFFGQKEKTKAEYVFALGSVSMLKMMLSIGRSPLGVRSVLGFPSELFYRGSAMWETLYGLVTALPIVCFVFVPVYFSLSITSVYQYLDLRFKSRLVRRLASATYIVRILLTLGATIYTPAVALNTVIGIPYWASLGGITLISISFNMMGGLRAAITADFIQVITIIVVSIGIIIQASYAAGGVEKVYNLNRDSGRLEFFKSDGDVTVRVDTVSAWVGQLFMSLSIFGCQQNLVQRYLSMKSIKAVTKTLMANIPVIIILFSLSWVAGMAIYAAYSDCDPLAAGYINKRDEILPFFVEDKFDYFPGVMGLFMAALFNGALSINISNLNSLATVTWEDFVSQLPQFKGVDDKKQLRVIKLIGVVYGFIVMGVGYSVGLMSGVIECSMLMSSATTGPLLGVFLLAMLIPIANWKGAATGMVIAHITTIWITFGSFTINKGKGHFLPTSTAGCTNETFSTSISSPHNIWNQQNNSLPIDFSSVDSGASITGFPQVIYAVTYMYYSLIGTFLTVFIGWLVSWMTTSPDDAYDSNLLHPAIYKLSLWLPGPERQYTNHKNKIPRSPKEKKTKANESSKIVMEQANLVFEMRSENENVNSKFVNGIIQPILEPEADVGAPLNIKETYTNQ